MSRPKAPAPKPDKFDASTLRAPTAAEARSIADARARQGERGARAAVVSEREGETLRSYPPHSDHAGWIDHLADTCGSTSRPFGEVIMGQLENLLRQRGEDQASDQRMNFALAALGAVEPKDELQAMLGVQVIGAHVLAAEYMARAHLAETLQKAEAYVNMATKLARTMAVQSEALARLKAGGKQRIEVVYVDARGSQNVIQAVQGGGGGGLESGQSLALAGCGDAFGSAVRGEDAGQLALPSAGCEGTEALQDARRDKPRRATRPGKRALHLRAVDAGAAGRPGARAGGAGSGGDRG